LSLLSSECCRLMFDYIVVHFDPLSASSRFFVRNFVNSLRMWFWSGKKELYRVNKVNADRDAMKKIKKKVLLSTSPNYFL
jgi:hypothetical protein